MSILYIYDVLSCRFLIKGEGRCLYRETESKILRNMDLDVEDRALSCRKRDFHFSLSLSLVQDFSSMTLLCSSRDSTILPFNQKFSPFLSSFIRPSTSTYDNFLTFHTWEGGLFFLSFLIPEVVFATKNNWSGPDTPFPFKEKSVCSF